MKQEDKDLLRKDLCARLPYGVKVHAKYTDLGETIEVYGIVKMTDTDGVVGIEVMYDASSSFIGVDIDDVKPYLFPFSSMTKEELREYNYLYSERENNNEADDIEQYSDLIDWFNKNHFDYRGLIEKGLAIDATGLNIYKNG